MFPGGSLFWPQQTSENMSWYTLQHFLDPLNISIGHCHSGCWKGVEPRHVFCLMVESRWGDLLSPWSHSQKGLNRPSCPLHRQSKDVGRRGWRMGELSRVVRARVVSQWLNLHMWSDWMTDSSLPKKLNFFLLFDGAEGSNGAHGSTMHCASVHIQSQWGSINGRCSGHERVTVSPHWWSNKCATKKQTCFSMASTLPLVYDSSTRTDFLLSPTFCFCLSPSCPPPPPNFFACFCMSACTVCQSVPQHTSTHGM